MPNLFIATGKCRFSYGLDGKNFIDEVEMFLADVGRWKGAKIELFCTREKQINDSGFAAVNWFRIDNH